MYKPSPGGDIYVFLQFDKTSPSLTIPIPNLFALPSNPILITIMVIILNYNFDFNISQFTQTKPNIRTI